MNIYAVGKSLFERFDIRHRGQQTQFNLRVITGNEFAIGFGNKARTDFFALFAADGNILQIGIG